MSENKDQVIRMRLTDDYKRQIQALADREGITLTELLSSAVDDYMRREGGSGNGFWIREKFKQRIDYSIDQASDSVLNMISCIAERLTDREYHELCHQLHGTKSEFDGPDDGECHLALATPQKRAYTVKSALYRGIFWQTINEVRKISSVLYPNESPEYVLEKSAEDVISEAEGFVLFLDALKKEGYEGDDHVTDLEDDDLFQLLAYAKAVRLNGMLALVCSRNGWPILQLPCSYDY